MPDLDVPLQPGKPLPSLRLKSRAFGDGSKIPMRFTADGDDLSPPLTFSEPPPGTKSLALLGEDPDAPSGLFVHWLVWNIPPETRELEEGAAPGVEGTNGFGRRGWGGPSAPRGSLHRYVFRLLALDAMVQLGPGASRSELERAVAGHVLAEGTLTGRYGR